MFTQYEISNTSILAGAIILFFGLSFEIIYQTTTLRRTQHKNIKLKYECDHLRESLQKIRHNNTHINNSRILSYNVCISSMIKLSNINKTSNKKLAGVFNHTPTRGNPVFQFICFDPTTYIKKYFNDATPQYSKMPGNIDLQIISMGLNVSYKDNMFASCTLKELYRLFPDDDNTTKEYKLFNNIDKEAYASDSLIPLHSGFVVVYSETNSKKELCKLMNAVQNNFIYESLKKETISPK
jgi:hypothetical protein